MALADTTLLILRLVVGLTFAAHGAQKAFGWWNGPGIEGWQKIVAGMRFHPAPLWTLASVGAELVGGVLIAIGLFTPLAASLLIGQSVVIILKVHLPNGFWNKAGGIEFPLALAAGVSFQAKRQVAPSTAPAIPARPPSGDRKKDARHRETEHALSP